MLKLTKKADYGLISLKHLAMNQAKGSASAKELADAYRIPVPMLAKVLQTLVREGFLVSEQGTNGGYRLARDPGTITTLEVVRAIDGPVILTTCASGRGGCDLTLQCTVREPLRRVHEGILKLLDNITITDLASEEELLLISRRPESALVMPVLGTH
jgi:Rrf2 family protein